MEQQINYQNLGAIQRPEDKRDFKIEDYVGTAVARTTVFMQDIAFKLPILMQDKYGTCGAHAGAWYKMLQESNQMIAQGMTLDQVVTYYSPRYLWAWIKTIDGFGLNDGTDIRSIFKSLQAHGICNYVSLPNDFTTNIEDYSAISHVTPAMNAEGAPRGISSYAFSSTKLFEGLKDLIYANKGVVILMRVGTGLYSPSWKEADILPLKLGTPVGGHFVVAHSYDENYIYFANSFSDQWGRKGHGYFGPDYMQYLNEIGTAIDLPAAGTRYVFTNFAGYGQTSELIRQLQIRFGMPVTQQTGYWGPLTETAFIKWLMKNNMPQYIFRWSTNAAINAVLNTT